MTIDYSSFAFPKGRVKALDVQDKKAAIVSKDKAENAKAKLRAKGQCEVKVVIADINGKILRPTTAEHDAQTVRYWRAK